MGVCISGVCNILIYTFIRYVAPCHTTFTCLCTFNVIWQKVTGDYLFTLSSVIHNIMLLTGERLHDIVIEALKKTEVSICEVIVYALKNGETRRIPCQPRTVGNVIKIRQNATKAEYFTLCEVEVYGTQGKLAIELKAAPSTHSRKNRLLLAIIIIFSKKEVSNTP